MLFKRYICHLRHNELTVRRKFLLSVLHVLFLIFIGRFMSWQIRDVLMDERFYTP